MTSNPPATVVPLVRPSFPPLSAFVPLWDETTANTGQFSNFGALWSHAAEMIEEMTDRIAIPCSSGTSAVALAIAAAKQALGFAEVGVAFEAFTFQATAIAARQVCPFVSPIRSGAPVKHRDIVVRTIPFGMGRKFQPEMDGVQLVIDAAGAFHPDEISNYPADAFVACSFHSTKNFPIGEGGVVLLPKHATWAADTIRAAMNFGMDPERNIKPGWATNAKLDELHSSILIAQLRRGQYFAARSARIAATSRLIAGECVDFWLPYDTGRAQSLVVVAHKDPDTIVRELALVGFVARRVYHPHVEPGLLTYDEARLVALPSDMVNDECNRLIEAMKAMDR